MSLDIQLQIRNQANETRQSLTAVKNWEEEIEARDRELIELAKKGQFGYEQPQNAKRAGAKEAKVTAPKKVEIKNENETEKPKEIQIKENPTAAPTKGSYGRSYEEWQKIDAKLKQMEAEGDDDEPNPKESAEKHKETGNSLFKAKKYEAAIKEYTAAIKLDPTNAVYYFNRATAHFSNNNYRESEKDATEAIKYDPRYVKAYMRRALAREALGKDYEALQDLEVIEDKSKEIHQIADKLVQIRSKLGISPDGKIKAVQEPKFKPTQEEKPVQSPKVQVISEEPTKPKVQVVEEEPVKPKVVEEEPELVPMPQAKSHRAVIVEEESVQLNEKPITAPSKVEIVSEETKQPKKISIVTEEEPKPKKVAIISEEEEPKPKKVAIVAEEEEPKPKKVAVVAEEETPKPKKVAIVSEEETPKKPEKKVESTLEQHDDAMKDALAALNEVEVLRNQSQKAESPKKAKKAVAPKNISWSDLRKEQYPEILAKTRPSIIAESIGAVMDANIIRNIVTSLDGLPTKKAVGFLKYLAKADDFEIFKATGEIDDLKADVKKVLEKYRSENGKESDITECEESWEL